jgi:hypothetical protein
VALAVSANNQTSGIRIEGTNNLVMHVTAANHGPANGLVGLQVGASLNKRDDDGHVIPVETTGTQIVNVISTNNIGGLMILVDSEHTRVHDAWLGTNGGSLMIAGSYNVLTGTLTLTKPDSCMVSDDMYFVTVQPGLAAGPPCATADDSTAAIMIDTLDTTNSLALVGHRREQDPLNDPVDVNGQRAYVDIADWFSFSHRLRNWGKPLVGATLPNFGAFGRCDEDSGCGYWDWRVSNEDSSLRDPLAQDPDGFAQALEKQVHARTHVWSATTAGQCGAIDGAEWSASLSECTSRFVAYAYEPLGDDHGNDNLLCETDEHCILNRNRGAYPGHGKLRDLDPGASSELVELPDFGGFKLQMFEENGP